MKKRLITLHTLGGRTYISVYALEKQNIKENVYRRTRKSMIYGLHNYIITLYIIHIRYQGTIIIYFFSWKV